MANLDAMIELTHQLSSGFEFLLPVAGTIDRKKLEEYIAGPDEWWPAKPEADLRRLHLHLVPDAREALHHARASVVASGTATIQAAVIGNPFVVVYRVSSITFRLAKRLVHYSPEIWSAAGTDADDLPIAMVNLIAGRRIVTELLQNRFTAKNVAAALAPLLAETPQRQRMIADLAQVRDILRPDLNSSSIQRVCDAVEVLLSRSTPAGGLNATASV